MPDPITTTTASNNSSAGESVGLYAIEQGPVWLADLLMRPPWWLEATAYLIAFAAVAVIVVKLRRNAWVIPRVVQAEMAYLAGVVVCTILGTRLAMSVFSVGYLGDVLVGVVLGQLGPQVARQVEKRSDLLAGVNPLVAGWAAIAVLAFVGPLVLPVETGMLALAQGRLVVGVFATVMVGYNHLEVGDADGAAVG